MPDYLVEFDVQSTTRHKAVVEADSADQAKEIIASGNGSFTVIDSWSLEESDEKKPVSTEKILNSSAFIAALNDGYTIYNHHKKCYYWRETIHDPVGGDKDIILCSGLPFGEHDIIDGVHRVWMCDIEGHNYILTVKEKK